MKPSLAQTAAGLLAAAALAPLPVSAHHHRINFLETMIVFHGEITRVEWKNPHVYIYVDAEDENGEVVNWEIETGSTPSLTRRGLSMDSLKAGDLLTVRGNPDRNPERKLLFAELITKSDGTSFTLQGRSVRAPDDPAVRTDSLAGIWSAIGNPYDRTKAATHLPLTDKARVAAAAFDVANDPLADCVPPPVPDSFSTPYLHEIIINDDTIILREEYWETDRIVYMDGSAHPIDGPRTNQGHSIGRWEGDVLVVDTVLFEDHAFGNGSGIPSGSQKRIVERYSLTDNGTTITIDYELEDPEYLAEPVIASRQWRYSPQLQMIPNQCDLEIAQRYVDDE